MINSWAFSIFTKKLAGDKGMSVEGKVKKLIKEYYVNCRKLKIQKERVKLLEVSVAKAKADIKSSNVFMNTDIRAMRFDSINVQVGSPKSQIDIELEKSSDRLMSIYSQEMKEYAAAKKNVQRFEKKTIGLQLIIKSFDDVEQRMLSMRFNDARSFKVIGVKISLSESSVKRNIDRMIIMIAEDLGIKEVTAS